MVSSHFLLCIRFYIHPREKSHDSQWTSYVPPWLDTTPTCITDIAVSPRAGLRLGGAPDGKLGPPVEKERLRDMMTLSRPLASG